MKTNILLITLFTILNISFVLAYPIGKVGFDLYKKTYCDSTNWIITSNSDCITSKEWEMGMSYADKLRLKSNKCPDDYWVLDGRRDCAAAVTWKALAEITKVHELKCKTIYWDEYKNISSCLDNISKRNSDLHNFRNAFDAGVNQRISGPVEVEDNNSKKSSR